MQNSVRGAVECTLLGEPHTLRFTQGAFLWLEEKHGIGFDEVRAHLAAMAIPWKLVPKFIAAGLLHEDATMTEERARAMVDNEVPADLQLDLFSALIFALNGAEEKKVEMFEKAMALLMKTQQPPSAGEMPTTGITPNDSPSTAE